MIPIYIGKKVRLLKFVFMDIQRFCMLTNYMKRKGFVSMFVVPKTCGIAAKIYISTFMVLWIVCSEDLYILVPFFELFSFKNLNVLGCLLCHADEADKTETAVHGCWRLSSILY